VVDNVILVFLLQLGGDGPSVMINAKLMLARVQLDRKIHCSVSSGEYSLFCL
jgi:hypothetical protein